MIVQYASDLHLEFPQNKDFLKSKPLKPIGDILILAGDIVPFAVMDKQDDFFNYISDHFQTSYWIPGNHEYYYSDISERSGTLNEKIRSNVFLVNNLTVQHNSVNFIFSSLWSNISPENQWQVQQRMSDFHVIKYNGSPFTPQHFNMLHKDSLKFLSQALHQYNTDKTVVASHHVPTLLNYPEKYKGDALNDAFAIELFDLIESNGPDYWIFGHSHCNTNDFTIGKTGMRTNQLGYVKYQEYKGFKNGGCVTV